jgi:hypothetical protein
MSYQGMDSIYTATLAIVRRVFPAAGEVGPTESHSRRLCRSERQQCPAEIGTRLSRPQTRCYPVVMLARVR